MSLRDPNERRALRSIVQAAVALVVLGFVGWTIHLLTGHAGPLERMGLALVAIVGLGTVFYGAENVTRAVRFKAGATGIEGEIGDAVDAVVEAASDKAGDIKNV